MRDLSTYQGAVLRGNEMVSKGQDHRWLSRTDSVGHSLNSCTWLVGSQDLRLGEPNEQ